MTDSLPPGQHETQTFPRFGITRFARGRGVPGFVLRRLYRPLIGPTVRRFERAMARYRQTGEGD